jgi:AbrB family looped-hinge helix DNA binding protein
MSQGLNKKNFPNKYRCHYKKSKPNFICKKLFLLFIQFINNLKKRSSKMFLVTISSKGQIAIPARIRKKLNIIKGTRCTIEERNGELVLQPISAEYLEKAAGVLQTKSKLNKLLLRERMHEKQREP